MSDNNVTINSAESRWLTVEQIAEKWNVSVKATIHVLRKSGMQSRKVPHRGKMTKLQYWFDPNFKPHFRADTIERGFIRDLSLEDKVARTMRAQEKAVALQEKAAAKSARLLAEAKARAERIAKHVPPKLPAPALDKSRIQKVEEVLVVAQNAIDYLVDELIKVHDRLDVLERGNQRVAGATGWNPVRKVSL